MTVEQLREALLYADGDATVGVLRYGDNPFAGGMPIGSVVQIATLDITGEIDPCIFLLLDEV